jgi:MOSC domain-containing protein YiiM
MRIPHDLMHTHMHCALFKQNCPVKIVQVSVGVGRQTTIKGRQVMTGIYKQPVTGPVGLSKTGLQGDEQADLSRHGGLSKAVYAYPQEHLALWRTLRAQARVSLWDEAVPAGLMGENLLIEGLLEADMWIGDRLLLPHCVLAISEPRFPCFKFIAAMGFEQAAKMMVQSGTCGSYLAVVEPGTLQAGDAFTVQAGPREVSIAELFRSRAKA